MASVRKPEQIPGLTGIESLKEQLQSRLMPYNPIEVQFGSFSLAWHPKENG